MNYANIPMVFISISLLHYIYNISTFHLLQSVILSVCIISLQKTIQTPPGWGLCLKYDQQPWWIAAEKFSREFSRKNDTSFRETNTIHNNSRENLSPVKGPKFRVNSTCRRDFLTSTRAITLTFSRGKVDAI